MQRGVQGSCQGLTLQIGVEQFTPPPPPPHPPEMKPSHSWTTWTSDLDVTRKINGIVSRRRIVYCPQPKNENSQMTWTSDLGTTVYPPSLKTSQRQVGRTVLFSYYSEGILNPRPIVPRSHIVLCTRSGVGRGLLIGEVNERQTNYFLTLCSNSQSTFVHLKNLLITQLSGFQLKLPIGFVSLRTDISLLGGI